MAKSSEVTINWYTPMENRKLFPYMAFELRYFVREKYICYNDRIFKLQGSARAGSLLCHDAVTTNYYSVQKFQNLIQLYMTATIICHV